MVQKYAPTLAADGMLADRFVATQTIGSRFATIGDSITIGGEYPVVQWPFTAAVGDSWPSYAEAYSRGALQLVRNAGIAGNTTAQMLARFDADVTPWAPNVVNIAGGTNDSFQGVSDATFTDNIKALVAKVRAIGAVATLTTIPPVNGADSAQRMKIYLWNDWLKRYAAANRIPLVDFHRLLVNPATGAMDATGDGVHPNALARRDLGEAYAIALTALLVPAANQVIDLNTDPTNMLTNGLFLGDANSDGIADGWTAASSIQGTPSLTTDAQVPGGLQRVTKASGQTEGWATYQDVTTGFAVGDPLYAGLLVTQAASSQLLRAGFFIQAFTGGGALMGTINRFVDRPISRGVLGLFFQVPSGGGNDAARIRFHVWADVGEGTIDFGRATLRKTNLSI